MTGIQDESAERQHSREPGNDQFAREQEFLEERLAPLGPKRSEAGSWAPLPLLPTRIPPKAMTASARALQNREERERIMRVALPQGRRLALIGGD